VGSQEFRKPLSETMSIELAQWRARRFEGLEPDEVKTEQARSWEKRLQAFARVAKIDLTKIPAKKSAPEKVVLATLLKTSTAVSNGWLADRLAMGQPASASQFVRRHLLNS
jgi:hypothetical protein